MRLPPAPAPVRRLPALTLAVAPGAVEWGGVPSTWWLAAAAVAVLAGAALAVGLLVRRRGPAERADLLELGEALDGLNAAADPAQLLEAVVAQVVARLPGAGAGILLLDGTAGEPLTCAAAVGRQPAAGDATLPARDELATWYRSAGRELARGAWRTGDAGVAPGLALTAGAVLVLELEAAGRELGLLVVEALPGAGRFPGRSPAAVAVLRAAAAAGVARAAALGEADAARTLAEDTAERLRQTLRRLEEAGRNDALTGLASRREGLDRLTAEWRRGERHDRPCVLLLVAVDDLAGLARRGGGPTAGDTALVEVARVVRRTLREHDVAARWNGDSFLLVLPETGAEGGRQAGERLREAVAQADIRERAEWLDPTVTVAVAELAVLRTPAEAVELARRALELARADGGNRVVVA